MARYGETKTDLSDSPHRALGARLRELRDGRGMSNRELADAMNRLGFDNWSWETAAATITGRKRHLQLNEIPALAHIFGISCDEILAPLRVDGQRPTPTVGQREVRRRLGASQEDFIPGFPAAAGQLAEIDALAEAQGEPRNVVLRRLLAIAIPAYKRYLA